MIRPVQWHPFEPLVFTAADTRFTLTTRVRLSDRIKKALPANHATWEEIVLVLGLVLCHSLAVTQTQSSSATFRIAGTVASATGGNALPRAKVTIADARNPERRQSIITSDDGRFEFKVSAGKYSLQGAKRGFITAAYDQHEEFSTAIVTGVGLDTENLVLRLAPSAVLSGKVIDELGDPVRHAMVSLFREDRRVGIGRIRRIRA